MNILINNGVRGRHGCFLAYSRQMNVLYLVSDDGGTLVAGIDDDVERHDQQQPVHGHLGEFSDSRQWKRPGADLTSRLTRCLRATR